MTQQIQSLQEEKAALEKQLAVVQEAFEQFTVDPEMYAFEITKAARDIQALKQRIAELEAEIRNLETTAPFPAFEGTVIRVGADLPHAALRFVRDLAPYERRRLTTLPLQAGQSLEGGEINLAAYFGRKIIVQGDYQDGIWVCQAKVLSDR